MCIVCVCKYASSCLCRRLFQRACGGGETVMEKEVEKKMYFWTRAYVFSSQNPDPQSIIHFIQHIISSRIDTWHSLAFVSFYTLFLHNNTCLYCTAKIICPVTRRRNKKKKKRFRRTYNTQGNLPQMDIPIYNPSCISMNRLVTQTDLVYHSFLHSRFSASFSST